VLNPDLRQYSSRRDHGLRVSDSFRANNPGAKNFMLSGIDMYCRLRVNAAVSKPGDVFPNGLEFDEVTGGNGRSSRRH